MILDAEERGELRPGGLVVEATAGNTGIGIAVVANARGYRTLDRHPGHAEPGKKDMLRLCGAELVEVPALPFANPNNYQHVGRRLAEQLKKTEKNGVLFADQWNNLDNSKAHYLTTGPEIWEQTGGKVDALYLFGRLGRHACRRLDLPQGEEQGRHHRASPIHAAPRCSICSRMVKPRSPTAVRSPKASVLARVTPIVEQMKVDKAYLIPDEEAVPVVFDLLAHEGLCLGGSTGINVAGAIRLAKDLGPGHTIVTVLCDWRRALSVEAVQSGIPARQEPAGAGLAGASIGHQAAVCRKSELSDADRLPVSRRFLSEGLRGARGRHHRARRRGAGPHRVLRHIPAGSPATPAR